MYVQDNIKLIKGHCYSTASIRICWWKAWIYFACPM